MRLTVFITVCITICTTIPVFGAATVFFKDGSKEVGTSAWIEGSTVYLSRSGTLYEFPTDEILLKETQRSSRIGIFADKTLPDSRGRDAGGARSHDLVERLMKGADVDRQIDLFIQQFETGVTSSAPNGELATLFSQALAGFDPARAKRRIRAYYHSHLDNASMEAILAWSKSALGVKITEAQLSSNAMSAEMAQQILIGLERNPPSPQRRALIRELDRAGRATEMAEQMFMDAVSGVMSAIPAGTGDRKQARREIIGQMKQKKAELAPLLRKQVQAGLTNAYRELSDDELRDYITFLHTEPARKYTKATMGALSEMTRDISASMIRQMVRVAEEGR
jgi:hypothetical protein